MKMNITKSMPSNRTNTGKAWYRCSSMLCAAAVLSGLLLAPAWGRAVEIVDDLGKTVALKAPAQRIVPLYGAFAEMLFDIGAGGQVAARTQADQYPPEITKLPSVGTHMRPNVEMILGLRPDLVIQSGSREQATAEIDRLREAGIAVAVFEPKDFEGIFSTMKRLGVLTGQEAKAQSTVEALQSRLSTVTEQLAGVKEPYRVFFEVRSEPLTGAGRGAIVQQILLAAGARNVLESDKPIVQYNFEALLVKDPDVYIVQRGPMNRNPLAPGKRAYFDHLRSIREGKVIDVDEFLFSRPGPRCVDAVEQLAAALYPDRFGRAGKHP